jgi:hypothetical protein
MFSVVSVYFIIDSVRKLLDTSSYLFFFFPVTASVISSVCEELLPEIYVIILMYYRGVLSSKIFSFVTTFSKETSHFHVTPNISAPINRNGTDLYSHHHHHHHLLSQVSFSLVLLLNQWCTPPLRLQVSDCSTFLSMRNVPTTTVSLCREYTECFPGIVYRFF